MKVCALSLPQSKRLNRNLQVTIKRRIQTQEPANTNYNYLLHETCLSKEMPTITHQQKERHPPTTDGSQNNNQDERLCSLSLSFPKSKRLNRNLQEPASITVQPSNIYRHSPHK
jgi:hypothetical protein